MKKKRCAFIEYETLKFEYIIDLEILKKMMHIKKIGKEINQFIVAFIIFFLMRNEKLHFSEL